MESFEPDTSNANRESEEEDGDTDAVEGPYLMEKLAKALLDGRVANISIRGVTYAPVDLSQHIHGEGSEDGTATLTVCTLKHAKNGRKIDGDRSKST